MVPVYRARLPAAEAILPYLRQIDASGQYSNRGPLVWAFERRLDSLLGGNAAHVVSAASGTAAIAAAILATAGPASAAAPLALMPSYTFVATAQAAELCGYRPWFVDVDAAGWALDPIRLRTNPQLGPAGVVVVAAPYGRLPDIEGWTRFAADTGRAVVIDAAASVEALARRVEATPDAPVGVPVAVSLHATKPLACGEGGLVLWSDRTGLERVARALNFGFLGSRSAQSAGFNGKMSEYHAAVGLAALDGWGARRSAVARLHARMAGMIQARGLGPRLVAWPDIASCYLLHDAGEAGDPAARTQTLARRLDESRIEHRFWYGGGVHREPVFLGRDGCDALPVTEALAMRLLGIPVRAPGGGDAEDEAVAARVFDAMEQVP